MARLIFAKGVIKEKTEMSPISGHEMVVYKRSGGKLTLYKRLSGKDAFQEEKRSFLDRLLRTEPTSYVGYAVDMNPYLEYEFTNVFSYNETNSFDLTYLIGYQVKNVERLVEKVIDADKDALEELKTSVTREIEGTLLKYQDVEDIANEDLFKRYAYDIANIYSFKDTNEADLKKILAVYESINQKVADVGLQVNKITVTRRLSAMKIAEIETIEAHNKKIAELDRNNTIRGIERGNEEEANLASAQHRNQLSAVERQGIVAKSEDDRILALNHAILEEDIQDIKINRAIKRIPDTNRLQHNEFNVQLRKQMNEVGGEVIKQIGSTINNAADARRAVAELTRTFVEMASSSQMLNSAEGAVGQNELSAATGKFLPPKLKNKALNETVQIFSQVVELLSDSDISDETTRLLMSKILYLLGELILGNDADEEKLSRYVEQTKKEFLSAMKNLNYDQLDLRNLTDLEKLRKKFR